MKLEKNVYNIERESNTQFIFINSKKISNSLLNLKTLFFSLEGIKKESNDREVTEKYKSLLSKYKKLKKTKSTNTKEQIEKLEKQLEEEKEKASKIQEELKTQFEESMLKTQKSHELQLKEMQQKISSLEKNGEQNHQVQENQEDQIKKIETLHNQEKEEMESKIKQLQELLNKEKEKQEKLEKESILTEQKLKEELEFKKNVIESNTILQETITINSDRKFLFEEIEKHAKTIEILTHENELLKKRIPKLEDDEQDDEIDEFEQISLLGNTEFLNWKTMIHYGRGTNPQLCSNAEGIIVQVQNQSQVFHFITGRTSIFGKSIRWKNKFSFDEGYNPSIAINASGIVAFVYNIYSTTGIIVRFGNVNPVSLKIEW